MVVLSLHTGLSHTCVYADAYEYTHVHVCTYTEHSHACTHVYMAFLIASIRGTHAGTGPVRPGVGGECSSAFYMG